MQDVHGFIAFGDDFLSDALDVHSLSRVLPQLQISVGFIEQIDDLLIVDFQEGAPDDEIYSAFTLLVDAVE